MNRAHQPRPMDVRIIGDLAGLRDVESAWRSLDDVSPQLAPFAGFDWLESWCTHELGSGRRLFIVTGWVGDSMICAVPLVRRAARRGGVSLRKLEFAGTGLSDVQECVVAPGREDALVACLAELKRQRGEWDILDLRHIDESSPTARMLPAALGAAGLRSRWHHVDAYYTVPLSHSWEQWLAQQSASVRHTIRKKERRLARLPGYSCTVTETVTAECLEACSAVEWSKTVAGSAAERILTRNRGFIEDAFTRLGRQSQVYVATMSLTDGPIAYEIGFQFRGRLLAYNKAYLPEWAYHSPGAMLIPAVLRYGHGARLREYDFLLGDEGYKARWHGGTWRRSLRVTASHHPLLLRMIALRDRLARPTGPWPAWPR
jgi:CelD/BcsL family acetyltransferase involved in cellulose biosynthesis